MCKGIFVKIDTEHVIEYLGSVRLKKKKIRQSDTAPNKNGLSFE